MARLARAGEEIENGPQVSYAEPETRINASKCMLFTDVYSHALSFIGVCLSCAARPNLLLEPGPWPARRDLKPGGITLL
jgi:hypothetical protein